ncbi:MAG: hypothetical protein AAGI53_02320 [Planctomycetota bacterium]
MTDVSGAESIRSAAVSVLEQGAAFIGGLEDDQYVATCDRIGASVGQHVRHALDHFTALLDAYESGEAAGSGPAAYDQRARGTDIEANRAAALEAIAKLKSQLGGLDEVQLEWPVTIQVMASTDRPEVSIESTLVRELAFVTHHAIHHWAICKIGCGEIGVECDASFGRAPSTLAHEHS